MFRTMGRAWLRLARAFLILPNFCGKPLPGRTIFSGQGKTKKGFLCINLCDMKIDSLTLIRWKFDSRMASYFCISL